MTIGRSEAPFLAAADVRLRWSVDSTADVAATTEAAGTGGDTGPDTVGAAAAFSASCALAEETTVTHRDPVPPGVGALVGKPLGDPGGTTVEHRSTGCQSTTVHKENEVGSKTVNRTDC